MFVELKHWVSRTVTHPDLAVQADGWDATVVTAGSNQKMSWICPQGHHFDAIVANRARLGRGCPYCSGRLPIPGVNDLATVNPALAAQAVGWDPSTVLTSSNKKLRWECGAGHQWEATLGSRSQGTGCPFCSGRNAITGLNDLATVNPALVPKPWDGIHRLLVPTVLRSAAGHASADTSGKQPSPRAVTAMAVPTAQTNWCGRAKTIWPPPTLNSPPKQTVGIRPP